MSNSPVPPPPPDGSEQSKPPAYGPQDVPGSGQQPPSAPQYGEQAPRIPQYGQPSPAAPQYGQQPAQSGVPGYGKSPYSQLGSEETQAPEGVPKLVNIAFWLIVGSGVAWVLSTLLIITLIDAPALREEFERQMAASGTEIAYESIRGMIVGSIVTVAAIGAGLYALVALNIRKGRNWARILGTVLAALSLFSLFPLGPGTLAALAGITGIVLLYLPESAPYFRNRRPFANPYGSPEDPFGR